MNALGFEYSIKRSHRRKTVGIEVSAEGVRVTAPARATETQIAAAVEKKQRWIQDKLRFHRENPVVEKPKEYISGEAFSYLGRNYRLKVEEGEPGPVKLKHGRLVVPVAPGLSPAARSAAIRSQLHHWYQQHAQAILTRKSKRLAKQLNVSLGTVSLRLTKSKWGHCTRDGDLQYNWLIVTAPHHIVDYVVAHEVCHLVHHDHSKAFWQLVERVCPQHRERKEWLKLNGYRLQV